MAAATDFNLPPNGALVRLVRKPLASWATEGETYRVRYASHQRGGVKGIFGQTSVQLWSEDRDAGTYDSARNWRFAQWEIVQ